jgi:p-aminobenzoyl-glutamate transporter AbgT
MKKKLLSAAATLYAAAYYHSATALAAGGGTTVDPSAPLQVLADAKAKAASSSLTSTDIATGGTNMANVIMVFAVVIGLALALWSGMSLYKSSQDENSRESPTRSIVGLVVGALITVIALVVGVIVNYSFG